MISSARPGSANRPWTAVRRSWTESSPSTLPTVVTSFTAPTTGAPFEASATISGPARTLTRFTPGRWAILVVNRVDPNERLEFGENAATVRSDGFVEARNVGYEDWVLRAPAIVPIASPPTRPTRTTIDRYPDHWREKVARNRYQVTRRT